MPVAIARSPRLTPAVRAKKFAAVTKLGRVRAETEASAKAIAGGDDTHPRSASLMFGGRHAAEVLGVDDDD